MYKPGDTAVRSFTTSDPTTQQPSNATITPAGVVRRNGSDALAVSVTMVNNAIGDYTASFTIPSGWAAGDKVELIVTATFGTTPYIHAFFMGVLDSMRLADLNDLDAVDVWTYATRTLSSPAPAGPGGTLTGLVVRSPTATRIGTAVTIPFTTYDASLVPAAPDSGPTASIYLGDTLDVAVTVAITGGAGEYFATFTLPGSYTIADAASLRLEATFLDGSTDVKYVPLGALDSKAVGEVSDEIAALPGGFDPDVDEVVGGFTWTEWARIVAATTAGKVSGAGTATEVFRGIDDAGNVVTAIVDANGNRTAITYGP